MTTASTKPTSDASKGRRVTIDLTPPLTAELDRLKGMTDLSTADVFRYAISLFRIYVDAKTQGEDLRIVNPSSPNIQTRIELPISVAQRP